MDENLIEIIEDRAALKLGMRIIMWTAEKKELPDQALLPTFHEQMDEDLFMRVLEMVAGKEYE